MDKNGQSYMKALAIINSGAEQLARRPRADMAGFRMCDLDQKRKAKYKILAKAQRRALEALIEQGKSNNEKPN